MSGPQLPSVGNSGFTHSLNTCYHEVTQPSCSPDGKRLAVQVNGGSKDKPIAHIWTIDLASGSVQRLGDRGAAYLDEMPDCFPNGQHIAFQSNRTDPMEIWVMAADRAQCREVIGIAKSSL